MGEILAAMYDPVMMPLDAMGIRQWRRWVVGKARGSVLELGVGTGMNFSHYGGSAQSVFAIDPDGASLERARRRRNDKAIQLQQGRAEQLPFADESFDTVVATLVFCSIGDPDRALGEVRRVLKPDGVLRLAEHVRVKNRLVGGVQDAATPLWKHIAGGCHLNRDTLDAVQRAGFHVQAVHRRWGGLLIGIEATKL